MPVYACLIVGSLHLKHDEGEDFDLNVCTVRYVFAGHKTEAKAKSIKKFLDDESFGGKISNVEMRVERIQEAKPWALWSRQAYWAWSPSHEDQLGQRLGAIKKTIDWHRHIS